jgi:hypothetical protein
MNRDNNDVVVTPFDMTLAPKDAACARALVSGMREAGAFLKMAAEAKPGRAGEYIDAARFSLSAALDMCYAATKKGGRS